MTDQLKIDFFKLFKNVCYVITIRKFKNKKVEFRVQHGRKREFPFIRIIAHDTNNNTCIRNSNFA
jgi:hypothetical protein